jgi:hypothetical protein
MQRRILETLEEARAAMPWYRGASLAWEWPPGARTFTTLGYAWVEIAGQKLELAPGVYDLRCSAAYLAEQDGHVAHGHVTTSFTACFARATKGLVQRGLLVRLQRVPATRAHWPRGSGATSFLWTSRQLRFVTLSANPVGLTLRGNRPGDMYVE